MSSQSSQPVQGNQGFVSFFNRILKHGDIGVAIVMMVIICFMMIPVPTWTLDLLLTINISLALLVLMVSLYVGRPLEFSTFPTLLLVLTLIRLSLNISSTRLILTQADAGKVIEAFGSFVIGGNYVVGILIFIILVVIQFVVITNGAGRISEVAARFTLDAMPGKQMAIDADLNSGLIDEEEAKVRRKDIQREADFYGSMDGASKFVRGDAIAGIIITFVNVIGGIVIGVFQLGMTAGESATRYTTLTIGDGLVSQIPAMVIAMATGILVSRAAGEADLGERVARQLINAPRGILVVAFFLLLVGIFTPLPTIPFLIISSILMVTGFFMLRNENEEFGLLPGERRPTGVSGAPTPVGALPPGAMGGVPAGAGGGVTPSGAAPTKEPEDMITLLKIDPIELEIGYRLIPLVDVEQGGDLLERITKIRRQTALQLGLVLPAIRVRDNIQLKPRDYAIKLRGVEIAQGEIHVGHYLAMNPSLVTEELEGIETVEPVFGLPAVWITEAHKERAEMLGYTVFDPSTVIATHVTEMVKRYASEILTRQDVQRLIDNIKEEAPAVVDELLPGLLSIGEIQRVLQNLLKERVSIRDMVPILESLANHSRTTKDPDLLTERARQSLARSICQQYKTPNNILPVITLNPQLEQMLSDSVTRGEQGLVMNLEPHIGQHIVQNINKKVDEVTTKGFHQPVLLCSSKIRLVLKRLTERSIPTLAILSYNEIVAPEVELQTIARVDLEMQGSNA